MKRFLALFLAVVMVVSMLPVSAFAEEVEEEETQEISELIEEEEEPQEEPEPDPEPEEEVTEEPQETEETVETEEPEETEETREAPETTEPETEEKPAKQPEEEKPAAPANPYAGWTTEQLLAKYMELEATGDEEGLDAMLDGLTAEQFAALEQAILNSSASAPAAQAVEEEARQGTTGDVSWIMEGSTLRIYGVGSMANYSKSSKAPWYDFKDEIRALRVDTGVANVGNYAMIDCENLKTVTLTSTAHIIGVHAFDGCTFLESVTMPGAENICDFAFLNCVNLRDIVLPSGLTELGVGAFKNCCSLEEIEIPRSDKITSLNQTFFGCTSLQSVTIPSSVTSMYNTFQNCTSLVSVEIPDLVTTMLNTFEGCTALESVKMPRDLETLDSAFDGCSSLREISIPVGVHAIGSFSFQNCESLTSLELPMGLQTIGERAFMNCSGLKSVTGMNALTSIEREAFSGCTSLDTFAVGEYPEGTGRPSFDLGDSVFHGCSSLTELDIPTITSLGQSVFADSGIETISLEGWTEIPEGTFYNCRNLKSIVIPEGVTVIPAGTFTMCESLEEVTLPESLTTIGDSAFFLCSSLVSIRIPAAVVSLGEWFVTGDKLERIDVSADNQVYSSVDGALLTKDGKKLIYSPDAKTEGIFIPDGVEEIGASALSYCQATYLQIPATVRIIGDYAFSGCCINSIEIPAAVTSIGERAFSNCYDLTRITFTGNAPEIAEDAFTDVRAAVQYPEDDATWDAVVGNQYGGTLYWGAEEIGYNTDSLQRKLNTTGSAALEQELVLEYDLVVPEGACLELYGGSKLVVPEGVTLTVYGELYSYRGTLQIDGRLENYGYMELGYSGSFVVNGASESSGRLSIWYTTVKLTAPLDCSGGEITVGEGCDIIGAEKLIGYIAPVKTKTEFLNKLKKAAADPGNVYPIDLGPGCKITLKENVKIPKNVWVNMQHGSALTIASGYTLTLQGCIQLYGGKLTVSGTYKPSADGAHVYYYADEYDDTYEKATTLAKKYVRYIKYTDEDYIYQALKQTGFAAVNVMVRNELVLTSSATIPANTWLQVEGDGNLRIADGVTLTNKGHLGLFASKLSIDEGGTLVNNSEIQMSTFDMYNPESVRPFIEQDGTLVNNGEISIYFGGIIDGGSGTYSGSGSYNMYADLDLTEGDCPAALDLIPQAIRANTNLEIGPRSGEGFLYTLALADQFKHTTCDLYFDDDIMNVDVTIPANWTLNINGGSLTMVNGAVLTNNGYINMEPGARLDITDSALVNNATMNVRGEIVGYEIFADNKEVISGKSVTLTSTFSVANALPYQVEWHLAEDETAATISGNVLKANAVSEKTVVTVYAYAENAKAEASCEVTIYPTASEVVILKGEEDVTGKTILANINESKTVTLSAVCQPEDNISGIKWSTSDTKKANSVLKDNGDGTCTVSGLKVAAGETKTITLTAKTTDGGGVVSTVKVKIAGYGRAQDVSITSGSLPKNNEMRGGAAKTLTASIKTTGMIYTNKTLQWSVANKDESDTTVHAVIDSAGKLTTYAVDAPTTIVVSVKFKSNPNPETRDYEIVLKPATQTVAIEVAPEAQGVVRTDNVIHLDSRVDKTIQLASVISPEDAVQTGATWKSSNTKIATVTSSGKVTFKTIGKVSITCTAGDGSGKKTSVTIYYGIPVENLQSASGPDVIPVGQTATLKAAITPSKATVKTLKWTSSNTALATVSSTGVVTAKAATEAGEKVAITASSTDGTGLSCSFELEILPKAEKAQMEPETASGVTADYGVINVDKNEIPVGGTIRLIGSTLPERASDAGTWKSSDTTIATVGKTSGVVTLKKAGSVTITFTAGDGSGKAVSTKLYYGVPMGSISFACNVDTLNSGKSCKLEEVVYGNSNATVKTLTLKFAGSAAPLSLSGTTLTAKTVYEPTEVTFYLAAADGSCVSATKTMTILPSTTTVTIRNAEDGAIANAKTLSVAKATKTISLTAENLGEAITAKWTSSDKTIATVSADGVVTFKKAGTVTITAKTADGKATGSFKLKIK